MLIFLQSSFTTELLKRRKVEKVEVSTVDSFQGREKEAIIISLVRSNEQYDTGFVKEKQRLNVAVTRAKRFLAVVADRKTMRSGRNKLISDLLKHIEDNGVVFPAKDFSDGNINILLSFYT